ncbi:acetylcholinesterase precursor [Flagelloscypha sp. PMI_526]|nr:acetylcholinesterase precursor [Flagelloscypha sp. PMI_526]
MSIVLQLLFFTVCALALGGTTSTDELPIVDVGYGRYQAANTTNGTYYTFFNIPYAASPSFSGRWKAPQPPAVNRTLVLTSPSLSRICPQSGPAWALKTDQLVKDQLGPNTPALLDPGPLLLDPSQPTPDIDPRTDEDCLQLDVYVPKSLLDRSKPGKKKVPVLFWIHGGGFIQGSKSGVASPIGLSNVTSEAFIFVAINYRLNIFGFLSGSQVRQHGDLNVGLLDQRMALEWVKKHISQFGGDPTQITIMGESAGGGSVMLHITAFGGRRDPLFHQAILQSPAWLPTDVPTQERTLRAFLSYLNVTTLDAARKLPFADVMRANLLTVGNASPEGRYAVNPVVDGTFIPDLPGKLFDSGRYHQGLRVLVGHNAQEGLIFTNPNSTDDLSFRLWMKGVFPGASESNLDDLIAHYPSTFDGSLPYTSQIFRGAQAIGDSTISAHAWKVASLEGHRASYAYLYNIPPAIHILDLFYTFYIPEAPTARLVSNVTTARTMQKGIVSFLQHGVPDYGLGKLEVYGTEGNIVNISANSLVRGIDPALNRRNKWWYSTGYNFAN